MRNGDRYETGVSSAVQLLGKLRLSQPLGGVGFVKVSAVEDADGMVIWLADEVDHPVVLPIPFLTCRYHRSSSAISSRTDVAEGSLSFTFSISKSLGMLLGKSA